MADATKPKHYQGQGMQVWDVWDAFDLGRYESNIVKYVLRYKEKNGVEDLKKARVYLYRLISRHEKAAEE